MTSSTFSSSLVGTRGPWRMECANYGKIFSSDLFFGMFLCFEVLNFWSIQNFDQFFEYLGWFKMEQNLLETVLKCMEL
jgi:hypothetical protein